MLNALFSKYEMGLTGIKIAWLYTTDAYGTESLGTSAVSLGRPHRDSRWHPHKGRNLAGNQYS